MELKREDITNKFTYNNDKELKINDCQCELCIYYNEGKKNDICPKNLMTEILKNEIKCPKLLSLNKVKSPLFTKDEAVKLYIERFGECPEFLLMGASDEIVKNKIIESLKSGKEITTEYKEGDYYEVKNGTFK